MPAVAFTSMRRAILLPVMMTLATLLGCDATPPDLGGAVVVPEPGTTSSVSDSGAGASLDELE